MSGPPESVPAAVAKLSASGAKMTKGITRARPRPRVSGAPRRTALGRQRFAHDRDRHAVHEHPGAEGVTDAPVAALPGRGVNPSHQDAASPM